MIDEINLLYERAQFKSREKQSNVLSNRWAESLKEVGLRIPFRAIIGLDFKSEINGFASPYTRLFPITVDGLNTSQFLWLFCEFIFLGLLLECWLMGIVSQIPFSPPPSSGIRNSRLGWCNDCAERNSGRKQLQQLVTRQESLKIGFVRTVHQHENDCPRGIMVYCSLDVNWLVSHSGIKLHLGVVLNLYGALTRLRPKWRTLVCETCNYQVHFCELGRQLEFPSSWEMERCRKLMKTRWVSVKVQFEYVVWRLNKY
ncbi:hypothetical protein CEXT_436271 [Caerostris extrusa]|uniref:Uncharacterized protein n=1 Tax=Caerostris extrusa TaxID=172846 RepID=A0AAV4MXZ8_CAEEX|nr:hypothetical protein CEXT_436271 [Caerostris extrusa]